jgi:hypothetical protein
MNRLLHKLNKMSPWHFLWLGIITAGLFTILSSLISSNLLWDKLSLEARTWE